MAWSGCRDPPLININLSIDMNSVYKALGIFFQVLSVIAWVTILTLQSSATEVFAAIGLAALLSLVAGLLVYWRTKPVSSELFTHALTSHPAVWGILTWVIIWIAPAITVGPWPSFAAAAVAFFFGWVGAQFLERWARGKIREQQKSLEDLPF